MTFLSTALSNRPWAAGGLQPVRRCVLALWLLLPGLPAVAAPDDGGALSYGPALLPVAATLALKAGGVESASSWRRLGVDAVASLALSCGTAYALKRAVRERRPDGADRHAFPSGHATLAFAGAAVLDREFRHASPWVSVAGYALAAGVAVERVTSRRHRWHDVATGAALGVGGTWLGYWLGDKLTGEHSRWQLHVGANELTLNLEL